MDNTVDEKATDEDELVGKVKAFLEQPVEKKALAIIVGIFALWLASCIG